MNLELSLDLVHSQGLAQPRLGFSSRSEFSSRSGAQPELGFSCRQGSVLQSISSCSNTSLPPKTSYGQTRGWAAAESDTTSNCSPQGPAPPLASSVRPPGCWPRGPGACWPTLPGCSSGHRQGTCRRRTDGGDQTGNGCPHQGGADPRVSPSSLLPSWVIVSLRLPIYKMGITITPSI